jgi:dTDP-4-dehydrorhamnose 3,5-epimerase-like enzyme
MTTKPFNKEYDGGVNIFDETIGIDWKILPKHHIISDKDKNMPTLNDILYKL